MSVLLLSYCQAWQHLFVIRPLHAEQTMVFPAIVVPWRIQSAVTVMRANLQQMSWRSWIAKVAALLLSIRSGLLCLNIPERKFCFPGHEISCVRDWLIDWVHDFSPWASSAAGGHERNKIWHKGSLGHEDDAWMLYTRMAQRKRVIPLSMVKGNRNVIECYNNIHQGAPYMSKQTRRTYIRSTAVLASTLPYCIHKICMWNGKLWPVTLRWREN